MSLDEGMEPSNEGGIKLDIKHKIVIMSGRDGIGKTTVAKNLAFALSEKGVNIGLLDIDRNGQNIARILDSENNILTGDENRIFPTIVSPRLKIMLMDFLLSSNDSPVIWRGTKKIEAIREFLNLVDWGILDYLIINLPAGTGDVPFTIAQHIKDVDGTIIITSSQETAFLDTRRAVGFSKAVGIPIIGLIENMSGFSCPHCKGKIHIFNKGEGEYASSKLGIPFLGWIPFDPGFMETVDDVKPLVMQDHNSESKDNINEIIKKIEDFTNSGKV
jgi:ATP-binding protein involved in chromosome partitioning